MSQTLSDILKEYSSNLDKCMNHMAHEFSNIRAGKASPGMLENVQVEYYGSPVPLTQVANVSSPDVRTILVQPWEKNNEAAKGEPGAAVVWDYECYLAWDHTSTKHVANRAHFWQDRDGQHIHQACI